MLPPSPPWHAADGGQHQGRLATRDLLDELRSAELVGGGPSAFGARDTQAFAAELNRFLQANS